MISTIAGPMRKVAHPGQPLTGRMQWASVTIGPLVRLVVNEGSDLFTVIHERLEALNVPGGAFKLVDGIAARVTLMTGGPGKGGLPMGFHGPHVLAAPLDVEAGAGVSGSDENGARFSHCHAAFRDAAGNLVGGHLLPGHTIAGTGGITVDLTPTSGGRFARRLDSETRFPIFHPEVA